MGYSMLICSSCGNLREECSDPERDWHPHESTCYATGTREWGIRRLREKHKSTSVASDAMHPLDGVSVWVSPDAPPEGEDSFA